MPRVRSIIRIDPDKCDGCGLCIPACEARSLRIIDGTARLVSDIYCDGLGTCLSACPQGALALEQREAAEFDPQAVERHLEHAAKAADRQHSGSAGEETMAGAGETSAGQHRPGASQLSNWPIQLRLVPITAPCFSSAELLLAADCTPFAFADFSREFIAGRTLLVGCPKLDDAELYRRKLAQILTQNNIRTVDVARMDVACCVGLEQLVAQAVKTAGKTIPVTVTTMGIDGEVADSGPLHVDSE